MADSSAHPFFPDYAASAASGRLFGGTPEPSIQNPLSSIFGNSPLANLIGPIAATQMHGMFGMIPGQFQPQQSLFDQYRARQYVEAQQEAMRIGAANDRGSHIDMMRGMVKMTGGTFTDAHYQAASTFGRDFAGVMPFLAQLAPQTFDAMHGAKGSALAMSTSVLRGGRFAVDPITGMSGMSGRSAGELSSGLFNQLYGTNESLAEMRGIGGGQAGSLFEELQSRGMLGNSIGSMSKADRARMTMGPGAGAAALGAGSAMLDIGSSGEDAELRRHDVKMYAAKIKNMTGAVTAMREIFGDAGNPNAPMSALMQGLSALTQNGLATKSGGELETIVRTSYVLAKQSGMSMDAMQSLTAHSASVADRMGDGRSGVVDATQGAMAFGSAYAQVGRGDLAARGRKSRDEYTMMDTQLRGQARSSGQALQLGVLMRYQEEIGGLSGSDVAKMVESIKDGNPSDGLYKNEVEFSRMMEKAGADPSIVASMKRSRSSTMAYVDKYKIGDIVRDGLQAVDVRNVMSRDYADAAASVMKTAGLSGSELLAVSKRVGDAAAKSLQTMGTANYTDPAKRDAIIQNAIVEDPSLSKYAELSVRGGKAMRTITSLGFGAFNESATSGELKGLGSALSALDLTNSTTRDQARKNRAQSSVDAELGKALAGLGSVGPMARFADLVMDPAGSAGEAISKLLGGISPAEVDKKLAGLSKLSGEDLAKSASGDKRLVLLEQLARERMGFNKAMAGGAKPEELNELTRNTKAIIAGGDAARTALSAMEAKFAGKGEMALSPEDAMKMRALKIAADGGLGDLTEKTDREEASRVSTGDLEAASARSDALADIRKKGTPADAKAAAGGVVNDINALSRKLLSGDDGDKAITKLGSGAGKQAMRLREIGLEMETLARSRKSTVADLLSSRDVDNPAVKAMHKYQSEAGGLMASLGVKSGADADRITPMSDAEKDAIKVDRAKRTKSGANADTIDALLKSQKLEFNSAQKEELAKLLGDEGGNEALRHQLGAGTTALGGLRTLGTAANPFKGGAHYDGLKASAGALSSIGARGADGSDGRSFEAVRAAITEFSKRPGASESAAAKADDGKTPDKIVMTGTLTIKDGVGTVTATGAPSARGSTPAPA